MYTNIFLMFVSYLITFTVVFETATSFTVTPFVMPPYNLWTTSFRFTYLRPVDDKIIALKTYK